MDVYQHIAVFMSSYVDRGLKSALSDVKSVVSTKKTHKIHKKKAKGKPWITFVWIPYSQITELGEMVEQHVFPSLGKNSFSLYHVRICTTCFTPSLHPQINSY
jgi:hypothetical protein